MKQIENAIRKSMGKPVRKSYDLCVEDYIQRFENEYGDRPKFKEALEHLTSEVQLYHQMFEDSAEEAYQTAIGMLGDESESDFEDFVDTLIKDERYWCTESRLVDYFKKCPYLGDNPYMPFLDECWVNQPERAFSNGVLKEFYPISCIYPTEESIPLNVREAMKDRDYTPLEDWNGWFIGVVVEDDGHDDYLVTFWFNRYVTPSNLGSLTDILWDY